MGISTVPPNVMQIGPVLFEFSCKHSDNTKTVPPWGGPEVIQKYLIKIFWLRSVAQIITPSGACYNLCNGTQPKLKRLNSELIMEALTYTSYLIEVALFVISCDPGGSDNKQYMTLEKYFEFWLRSVAQIITPSGAKCHFTKIYLIGPWVYINNPTKFHVNRTSIFLVILWTLRWNKKVPPHSGRGDKKNYSTKIFWILVAFRCTNYNTLGRLL